MGFTRTSEGRVFFKNADNDDLPVQTAKAATVGQAGGKSSTAAHATRPTTTTTASKVQKKAAQTTAPKTSVKKPMKKTESVMPRDNSQMQILLLLKSLNAKLKTGRDDRDAIKEELAEYKKTIKALEDKATQQDSNYLDLEKTVAKKQNEANKKTTRVEDSVKATLAQLDEAKALVKALEEQSNAQIETLKTVKKKITQTAQSEQALAENQKKLETAQKEQTEKMVSQVAAYVDLTKRVSGNETRQDEIDNKLDGISSDYMKLDRKIDRALEERNRILRKVERIEMAVLETRDALNAKAMVLLTDRGAVSGIEMPQLGDDVTRADPLLIQRRLQEEALMPWWRKPLRLNAPTLGMIMLIVLLVGWIMNGATMPARVNVDETYTSDTPLIELGNVSEGVADTITFIPQDAAPADAQSMAALNVPALMTPREETRSIAENAPLIDPIVAHDDFEPLDITNEAEMVAALDENPQRVAAALNDIEPSGLSPQDRTPPTPPVAVKNTAPQTVQQPAPPQAQTPPNAATLAALSSRIREDRALKGAAAKIQDEAFKGVPEAQHDMGAIYVSGQGDVKQNMARALLWFGEASRNGVANATYNLGVLHHQGLGTDRDVAQAMALYKKAAQQGHAEAAYNLGIAHIEGIGVAYNPQEAVRYFQTAADQGVTEAAYNLGLIHENGLLDQPQPELALAWYKTAADAGSAEAKTALGELAKSLDISLEDIARVTQDVSLSTRDTTPDIAGGSSDNMLVADIQQELTRRGLYSGAVDGMIGPMTRNAIRAFEAAANLPITGAPSDTVLQYLQASYR